MINTADYSKTPNRARRTNIENPQVQRLDAMGAGEISLGDTIGIGTLDQVRRVVADSFVPALRPSQGWVRRMATRDSPTNPIRKKVDGSGMVAMVRISVLSMTPVTRSAPGPQA